jgi:hypothetical protein
LWAQASIVRAFPGDEIPGTLFTTRDLLLSHKIGINAGCLSCKRIQSTAFGGSQRCLTVGAFTNIEINKAGVIIEKSEDVSAERSNSEN